MDKDTTDADTMDMDAMDKWIQSISIDMMDTIDKADRYNGWMDTTDMRYNR